MPAAYLIRHGQASFGASNYDVLSPTGHEQATLVAEELRRRGVAVAHAEAGSLQRQVDTAAAGGVDVTTDQRWNEYDHMAMLRSKRAATLWAMAGGGGRDRSRSIQKVLDAALLDWAGSGEANSAGQTFADFADGALAAVENLLAQAGSGGAGVAYTSGGVIAAACTRVLGLGAETFVALNRVVVNTGITTFVSGNSGTSLLSFNEHSHVAGLPGMLTYR